jgi:hypothetical protein
MYKIGKAGEEISEVEFQGELTVEAAVAKIEDAAEFLVTVNGQEPEEGQLVKDGDIILLVPEVNGG